MKKLIISLLIVMTISSFAFCSIYKYSFPQAPNAWGKPISFNNLSPGFFQVMYSDKKGVVRIATYGIAGGAMDELKDPQLMMVFIFDKSNKKVGMLTNE